MDLIWYLVGLALLGVFAGLVGALVGIGGGMIIVPFLVVFFDMPLALTAGIGCICALVTSIATSSAYIQQGYTETRTALFLETMAVPAAVVGATLLVVLSAKGGAPALEIVLAGVFVLIMGLMVRQLGSDVPVGVVPDRTSRRLRLGGKYYDTKSHRIVRYRVGATKAGRGILVGAGFISGMFGIGAGAIYVTALHNFLHLPMKVSTSTANLMEGITLGASASVMFFSGFIHPILATPVMAGGVLGAQGGVALMKHLTPRTVKIAFLPVIAFSAVGLVLKAMGWL